MSLILFIFKGGCNPILCNDFFGDVSAIHVWEYLETLKSKGHLSAVHIHSLYTLNALVKLSLQRKKECYVQRLARAQ